MFVKRVLVPLVMLLASIGLSGQPCSFPANQVRERNRLDLAYAEAFRRAGRTITTETERLLEERKTLDRQYSAAMDAVMAHYSTSDPRAVETCCAAVEHDPILRQFCALVRHRSTSRRSPARFVASMPRTSQQARYLWALDTIVGSRPTPGAWPEFRLTNGLVAQFLDELVELMKHDNVQAIEKYLFLYSQADGEIAQSMQDQLTQFVRTDPQIVISRWSAFRPYRTRLASIAEGIPPEESRTIRIRFAQLCVGNNARCHEIQELFR